MASRLQTQELASWVSHELDGYPDAVELPPYRGPFNIHVLGHFVGPFGAELKNWPIASGSFPADWQDSGLFKLTLYQSVAELADLASQETTNLAWTGDTVRMYNWAVQSGRIARVVREDFALATASRPVARHIFTGALDAVRNRILDLALELERLAPEAVQLDAPPSARAEAAQVVNNFHLFGPSNLAVSSSNFSQSLNLSLPEIGDFASLSRYLSELGLPDAQIDNLEAALEEDVAAGAPSNVPGPRVRAWLESIRQVGTGATGGLIVEGVTAGLGAFFGT